MTRARTTALASLSVFALGALVIAVGAAHEAPGPGIGPFLLLVGLGGLYAALCMAVGKVVLPSLTDSGLLVTEERFDQFRSRRRSGRSPGRDDPRP